MVNPSPSTTHRDRYEKLISMVGADQVLGIVIVADPDAIASALALKRLFWRRVRKTVICRANAINRTDNLALLRCLKIPLPYLKRINTEAVDKWALVDAQPHQHKLLGTFPFSIIIDHHPPAEGTKAPFLDIREKYGANSSIMTEYLRAAEIVPNARLATALFYGIKTDTDNFARESSDADIRAFRFLYPHVNLKIIKKIESSEINLKNLDDFRAAFEALKISGGTAFIHMGEVRESDVLVIIADFFLKMIEASWCVVSGILGQKIIVIIRHSGFRHDAGKVAGRLFGKLGSAGGHRDAARAEIPASVFKEQVGPLDRVGAFIKKTFEKR